MKATLVTALGVLSALSMMTAPARAAEVASSEAVNCLYLRSVDHTHVVDDQHILFYMRNGTIYLNRLEHPALGLDRYEPFMYQPTGTQLCRQDTITVLERWGFGLTRGASSTLGQFRPIDEARANALRKGEVPAGEEPVDAE